MQISWTPAIFPASLCYLTFILCVLFHLINLLNINGDTGLWSTKKLTTYAYLLTSSWAMAIFPLSWIFWLINRPLPVPVPEMILKIMWFFFWVFYIIFRFACRKVQFCSVEMCCSARCGWLLLTSQNNQLFWQGKKIMAGKWICLEHFSKKGVNGKGSLH